MAVDCCIRFTRKNNVFQHGGDWERSRPQGLKNGHNFLMTVRKMSWNNNDSKKTIFLDMTGPRFCMGSICGWNLFQSLGLEWSYPLLLLLWGLSNPRISELCERPRCFSIAVHSKTKVYDRLGMSGGKSSIVRFTLNSSTRVNEFCGFLRQFWTNFRDMLHRQLSSNRVTTMKISGSFTRYFRS